MNAPAKPIRIFWLAGESSGDLHAALVMHSLNASLPEVIHTGIGGPKMQAEGLRTLFPFGRFAVMGFVEVLKHLSFFMKVQRRIRKHFLEARPDLVILVDYPGLNMRIANLADNLRIPVLYYICPQFWAWKHERVFKLKASVRHVACILPFEKDLLDIHNVTCSYVGHPIAEEITFELDRPAFAAFFGLDPNKKWLGFLPGSRDTEIARMLPVFLQSAALFPAREYEFLFSKSRGVDHILYMSIIGSVPNVRAHIIDGYTYEMMRHADFLISTSGTATLEAGYIGTPLLIGYKASFLSYLIARHFIRVKRIGLPNIVLDDDVLPELVQNDLTPRRIYEKVSVLLDSPERLDEIKQKLAGLHDLLSDRKPSVEMPALIRKLLKVHEQTDI